MAVDSVSVGRHRRGYYLYLIPGFVGLMLIVIGPQIANFVLSFTAWKGVGTPRWVGAQNYQRLLTDDQFWGSMHNTLLYMISMTVIPVLIGLVLASLLFDYVRDQFGERLSSFFRAAFYLPQILPLTVAGVLWGWILSPVGVANAILKIDRAGRARAELDRRRDLRAAGGVAGHRLDPGGLLPRRLHGGPVAHRSRALRSGATRRRRLVAAAGVDHRAHAGARDLRRRAHDAHRTR